jgi:hypothetical protein
MTKAQLKAKPQLEVINSEKIPHLLVPGEVGLILELTLKDRDGKVTDHRLMRSKSFVRQFLELLWIQCVQIPEVLTYSVRGTDNTLYDLFLSGWIFASNAGVGDTSFGTVVGSGTTAPAIDDYKLESIIAHGVGAGQLQYSAVTFGAPASDSTTSQFTITRDFANGSGAAVTVNEVGLYVKGYTYNLAHYFLAIRDVIAGGISVPDGQTLTINYREQAVV